jgi:putative toxin-antitoxin system antitoxin component (TIGR02293 family)
MTTEAKSPGRVSAGKAPPSIGSPAGKPTQGRKAVRFRDGDRDAAMHQKIATVSFTGLVRLKLADLFIEVKGGLPPTIVDQGAEYLGVSKSEFADMLQLSSSSLSRWTRGKMVMPQAESDRVARVARVTLIVEDALGSREDAVEWLNSEIPALGNVKPLAMLGSDSGVKIVEDLLVRAQAGVYG